MHIALYSLLGVLFLPVKIKAWAPNNARVQYTEIYSGVQRYTKEYRGRNTEIYSGVQRYKYRGRNTEIYSGVQRYTKEYRGRNTEI